MHALAVLTKHTPHTQTYQCNIALSFCSVQAFSWYSRHARCWFSLFQSLIREIAFWVNSAIISLELNTERGEGLGGAGRGHTPPPPVPCCDWSLSFNHRAEKTIGLGRFSERTYVRRRHVRAFPRKLFSSKCACVRMCLGERKRA